MDPANAYYRTSLDYNICHLFNRSQNYEGNVASKIAKMKRRLDVQLKSQNVNGYDPVSILGFLPPFQMASDTNGFHKGAAMWLFPFF